MPGTISHTGVSSRKQAILSLLELFQKYHVVINTLNQKRVTWWTGTGRALEQDWSALVEAET